MNAKRLGEIESGAPPKKSEVLFCLAFTLAASVLFCAWLVLVIVDKVK